MLPTKTAERDPLTREQALRLCARIVALHDNRDASAIGKVFAEDAVYDHASWPTPVRGRSVIRQLLTAVWRPLPDFGVELLHGPWLSEDGRSFAVHGRVFGTMSGPLDPPGLAPTATRMSSEFTGFYEFDGEQLRYGRVMFDANDIARQLGALPPQGSVGEQLVVRMQRVQARGLRAQHARRGHVVDVQHESRRRVSGGER